MEYLCKRSIIIMASKPESGFDEGEMFEYANVARKWCHKQARSKSKHVAMHIEIQWSCAKNVYEMDKNKNQFGFPELSTHFTCHS